MECGLFCQIIEYKDCSHITVRFDTGEIADKKLYCDFVRGKITPRRHNYPKRQGHRRYYAVDNKIVGQ